MKDKHDNKLAHLNRIYGGQREKLVEIPPDIGEFKDCIAFNKNLYNSIAVVGSGTYNCCGGRRG